MKSGFRAAVLLPAAACIGLILGCPSAGGGGTGAANANDNGGGQVEVPDPMKSIGIHDPDSDDYDGDCISCHGERTSELALDGVTSTAHSTMLTLFGTDNARCTACHQLGPDFLTYSSAGLRKQVDITTCAACHGETPVPGATSFYMGEG